MTRPADPAPPGSATCYRRSPGWVSRWVRGTVVARHRDGSERRLAGSAVVTWMALEAPGTAAEVAERIGRDWLELHPVDVAEVGQVLRVLTEGALVEPVSPSVAP